jgi:hypothetical protein
MMETQTAAVECEHQWAHFQLPAERGRVVQCKSCRLIGHKRKGQGSSKVWPFKCSAPKCNGHARHRMFGRGPRGSYIWACDEHSIQIEGHDRPT